MPMILAGIDLLLLQRRWSTIKRGNDSQTWSWEDLRNYGSHITNEPDINPILALLCFSGRLSLLFSSGI